MQCVRFMLVVAECYCLAWMLGCSAAANGLGADAANQMNTFELITATGSANSIEEAGFLFYAAQMRFKIDMEVFPPTKTGADSPDVLKSALSMSVGQALIPKLAGDPVAKANVVNRLSKWTPSFKAGYNPGWEYGQALGEQAAAGVIAKVQKETLVPLKAEATLLADLAYQTLARGFGAANEAIQKIQARMSEEAKGQRVSAELLREFQTATEKKAEIARQMREIEWKLCPDTRWHTQVGWKAEDYFSDPQVISLCRAIEADDLPEMERLISAGVDVNTIGKDGMTLLLWAFPDRKLDRFECLLRHGANPNVFFESDFGVAGRPIHRLSGTRSLVFDRGCHAGQSVMHLAAQAPMTNYLKLVLAHGGDPNLIDKSTAEAPIDLALDKDHYENMKDRVELLVSHRADLNRYCPYHQTFPAMAAVRSGRYDVALIILKAGADFTLYQPDGERKLIHTVLNEKQLLQYIDLEKLAQYQALVDWLESRGESLVSAQADEDRWAVMYKKAFDPASTGKIRQKIIDARNAQQNGKAPQDKSKK